MEKTILLSIELAFLRYGHSDCEGNVCLRKHSGHNKGKKLPDYGLPIDELHREALN